MKITFLTPKLNFETAGGSVPDLDLKIRTLNSLGNEVAVITSHSQSNRIPNPLPYPVIEERLRARRFLSIAWGAYRIFRKYGKTTDVFHIDGHFFLYGAGLYRLMGGRKPIVAFFNRELIVWPDIWSPDIRERFSKYYPKDFTFYKNKLRAFLERKLGRFLVRRIDLYTFTSPVLRDVYKRFFNLKEIKSLIVTDLVDYPEIRKKEGLEKNYWQRYLTPHVPFTVMCAGRMVPGKGFDLMLEAFAHLSPKKNYKLIIGGSGPLEESIKALAEKLEIMPSVEFAGWLSKQQIRDYFKKSDLFVLPRWRFELTSVMLMEALAFGIPTVVPRGGGVEWQGGSAVALFRSEDPEDLAKTISSLARDQEARVGYSKNSGFRLEELNYNVIVKNLNEEIQNLSRTTRTIVR